MILISLLSLLSVSSANDFDLNGRIVNGEPIDANRYPWIGSLRFEYDYYERVDNSTIEKKIQETNFCTASLINLSPPIVLTAAHCVDFFGYANWTSFNASGPEITIPGSRYDYFQTPIRIYADINRTYPDEIVETDSFAALPVTDLSQIIMHPEYDLEWRDNGSTDANFWALFNDVAVILFDDSLSSILPNIPEDEMPILASPLSLDEPCCEEGEAFIAMGYGQNGTFGEGTKTLEWTTLKYVHEEECWRSIVANYLSFFNHTNNTSLNTSVDYILEKSGIVEDNTELCVLGNNTGACYGDSGGPLVSEQDNGDLEIVGVTSYGWFGCNSGHPSGYQSVAHFREWIDSVTGYVLTTTTTKDPTPLPTKRPTPTPTKDPTIKAIVNNATLSTGNETLIGGGSAEEDDDDDDPASNSAGMFGLVLAVWCAVLGIFII